MEQSEENGLKNFQIEVVDDDRIKRIEAEYGMEGFGVVFKLLQAIYKEGYFIVASSEFLRNFSKEAGVSLDKTLDIILDCVDLGIFDIGLYEDCNAPPSEGIQYRLYDITKKRKHKAPFDFVLIKQLLNQL